MTIQIMTHLGHRVATRLAEIEAFPKSVYIHLVLDVPWSRDTKRYSFRTR